MQKISNKRYERKTNIPVKFGEVSKSPLTMSALFVLITHSLITPCFAAAESESLQINSNFQAAAYFGAFLLVLVIIGAAIKKLMAKAEEYNLNLIMSWQFFLQVLGVFAVFLFITFAAAAEPQDPNDAWIFAATVFILPTFIIATIGNILRSNFVFGLILTSVQMVIAIFGVIIIASIINSRRKQRY